MFGISGFELLIIVAFVLLIFGPDKLPELARTLGKASRMFKKAQQEMEHMLHVEMMSEGPAKDLMKQQSAAATSEPAPGPDASEATDTATTAWAVTAEDDDEEEEDEE